VERTESRCPFWTLKRLVKPERVTIEIYAIKAIIILVLAVIHLPEEMRMVALLEDGYHLCLERIDL
jgi:hypothetical protein